MKIKAGYIRLLCVKRGVKNLVHFTRAENLYGIARHGLVPRWMLSQISSMRSAPIVNEKHRPDGHWDAVCLSIEFPDYILFERYRARDPGAVWIVLELSPSDLWEGDCAFCWIHAAAPQIRSVSVPKLREIDSLAKMYAPRCAVTGKARSRAIPSGYPTNPQAQVLVFGTVAPRYITGVCFETLADMKAYSRSSLGLPEPRVEKSYFHPRLDHELWKSAASDDAARPEFFADQMS